MERHFNAAWNALYAEGLPQFGKKNSLQQELGASSRLVFIFVGTDSQWGGTDVGSQSG